MASSEGSSQTHKPMIMVLLYINCQWYMVECGVVGRSHLRWHKFGVLAANLLKSRSMCSSVTSRRQFRTFACSKAYWSGTTLNRIPIRRPAFARVPMSRLVNANSRMCSPCSLSTRSSCHPRRTQRCNHRDSVGAEVSLDLDRPKWSGSLLGWVLQDCVSVVDH